jgi:hypothetical protein
VSDAAVGMGWSFVISFLILFAMESVAYLYRKGSEPEFHLIHDEDVILDMEISNELSRERTMNEEIRRQISEALNLRSPTNNEDEVTGPREMEGGQGAAAATILKNDVD